MTLTTEQLRARAKFWRKKAVDAKWQSVRIAQDMLQNADAFDELADNREAQPVLYASEETLAYAKEGEKSLVTWSEPMGDAMIPLYTAPPAPAVPGIDELRLTFERSERESDDGFNLHKYGIGYADESTQARWESWLACRAAMLAQPVSGGYTLVPAEPTEDMIAAAMNCDDVSFNADETFCVNFGNIYAAMLAAAPEGGNG